MSFEFSRRAFRAGSSVLMVLCSSQLEGTRAQDAAAIGVPQFAEEESPESRHRAGAVGQRRTGGAKRRELMEEVEQVIVMIPDAMRVAPASSPSGICPSRIFIKSVVVSFHILMPGSWRISLNPVSVSLRSLASVKKRR